MGERENYQEKVDAQLHEWQEWIQFYRADHVVGTPRLTTNHQQMLERLDVCHQAAKNRLEELRSAQGVHWELSKQAVERAMIDLKKLLDESGAAQAGRSLSLQTNRSYIYEPFSKRG